MPKIIAKTSLIEQVKNLIKEEIASGILQPGQRIESIRSLLKKYKVSHITAATALKQLKEEGWINSKVGSGSFVSETPPVSSFKPGKAIANSANVIYFVIMGGRSLEGYHSQVLEYLQELVGEHNLQLKFISADDSETLKKIASSPTTLGIICQAEMKPFAANVPVVNYGMSPFYFDSCFVQPDNFEGGILSGQILLKNGHEKICYVSNSMIKETRRAGVNYEHMHFRQRYNGLCAALEMIGQDDPNLVRWHVKTPESRQAVTELLEKVKAKDSEAPTVLVVGNKIMASEISMIAIGMGIQIPGDLSIISFIDRGENRDNHISTIDFSRKAMAQQLLSIILRARDSRAAINHNKHLLPMFLSNSSTIKNLNISDI